MLRVHLLVVIFCADPMQQVRQTFVGWPAYGDYASGIYSRTCKRIGTRSEGGFHVSKNWTRILDPKTGNDLPADTLRSK